jgi:hypothetical protein
VDNSVRKIKWGVNIAGRVKIARNGFLLMIPRKNIKNIKIADVLLNINSTNGLSPCFSILPHQLCIK